MYNKTKRMKKLYETQTRDISKEFVPIENHYHNISTITEKNYKQNKMITIVKIVDKTLKKTTITIFEENHNQNIS